MLSVKKRKIGFELSYGAIKKENNEKVFFHLENCNDVYLSEILQGSSKTPSAILDPRARQTSFFEFRYIKKVYGDILGTQGIDHFSINVVPENKQMLIFSIRPQLAYNLYQFSSGVKQDLAISPMFYENLNQYFWEDCYDQKNKHLLIEKKEKSINLNDGVVFVHRENKITYLLSFGTKGNKDHFRQDIKDNPNQFREAGLYCIEGMKCRFNKYINL